MRVKVGAMGDATSLPCPSHHFVEQESHASRPRGPGSRVSQVVEMSGSAGAGCGAGARTDQRKKQNDTQGVT